MIITSALPYANGEIHLGHISSTYLPADIFRRFLKLNEVEVYHLCASDDFGTPILIETEKKNTKPEIYVKHWHDKDLEDFKSLGIIFDSFSQTSWKGTVNTSWATSGNWTAGVPTRTTPQRQPRRTVLPHRQSGASAHGRRRPTAYGRLPATRTPKR